MMRTTMITMHSMAGPIHTHNNIRYDIYPFKYLYMCMEPETRIFSSHSDFYQHMNKEFNLSGFSKAHAALRSNFLYFT